MEIWLNAVGFNQNVTGFFFFFRRRFSSNFKWSLINLFGNRIRCGYEKRGSWIENIFDIHRTNVSCAVEWEEGMSWKCFGMTLSRRYGSNREKLHAFEEEGKLRSGRKKFTSHIWIHIYFDTRWQKKKTHSILFFHTPKKKTTISKARYQTEMTNSMMRNFRVYLIER